MPNAVLPAYKTDNPLTGYEFEIEIQHLVPERSSFLALAGGIAGLGGLILRKKKSEEVNDLPSVALDHDMKKVIRFKT